MPRDSRFDILFEPRLHFLMYNCKQFNDFHRIIALCAVA